MKHAYNLFLTLLLSLAPVFLFGQTTVAVMNFDGSTPEMGVSTDVPFFDNNSDGFFGIHDGNANPNDGVPTDTGDGNATDIGAITLPSIIRDFLFVNDLDDEGDNGTTGEATVTFGPVSVAGQTDLLFSFDYDVVGFDGGDDVFYQLNLDGVPQGRIQLIDGGTGGVSDQGTENIVIPDGTNSVSLELIIIQNGDSDQAAFDNFIVSADNPGQPCGITGIGPRSEECVASTAADNTDEYQVRVGYTGVDADVTINVTVGGASVAFTNNGDDPTSVADGELLINSASFIEGTTYEITLRGGDCLLPVSGSVASDFCTPSCDLSIAPEDFRIFCDALTSGLDGVSVEIGYTGIEPSTMITATGSTTVTVSGDDPATDEDGFIDFTGLVEGGTYNITIRGGDCVNGEFVFDFTVPTDQCTQSDFIINEVLADDGAIDANNDGSTTDSDDEFVELFNIAETDLDVSGWTIEQNSGIFYQFGAGTIIPRRTAFVVFGGGAPNLSCLTDIANVTPFIGLNNGGDFVVVRDGDGKIVSQMSYGPEGGNDQSLSLAPDGDLAGGYVLHTTIATNPVVQSACIENDDPNFTLPVELTSFTGTAREKSVLLEWTTVHEENNDKFIVERSADGQSFRQLSSVPARGGGRNADRQYTFVDQAPLAGQNYYRLRQVDLDGSHAIYGPVSVVFEGSSFTLYPNPARETLRLTGSLSGEERLTLLAADGRQLREFPLRPDLDVRDLKPGIYLLRIEGRQEVSVLRFVKQ
ncbi:lamin tail domain-containing protein [Lewinella sp. W8]|uniref:lamin tail domain-containing protein n=1 Tax=Lewinella sp. W8 TaxID=2528208 RepID=UPI0010671FD6|nr:lamin tail domain-containing protein [Lewinella sp. W8]MTB53362.1 T9SS type A sorting domain-containing protein [Lewinella sp. W8]